MKFIKRLFNPVIAFIGIQLVWLVVVFFWIRWFMERHWQVRELAEKYSHVMPEGTDWFILVEGLVLLAAILVGVYVIYLYWRRQSALLKAKRDFISQVTHELKSPLASLQLHIETIRRNPPPPLKLETFLDNMLSDTDRLSALINNLLSANRLEQRGIKLSLKNVDFSEFVLGYFRPLQYSLPRAGTMEIDIEPGLYARIEGESIEIVFRNLLENAILYSPDSPELKVELKKDGRYAHFVISDQGRGIVENEQKKVFRMFYRGMKGSETIKGTGLGLFITKAIVRLHKGKTWLESPGPNRGTAVHIQLPLDARDEEK
ncbi:MAG: sensor histidine kinase [Desulfuromonas sp.]|nr:MAG: sensor histidine kinase [Desulfuromonas sp.]